MASYYETTAILDFSWKQVTQAFWNRYPNPLSAHVLTEDTISRSVRNGKLYTRRVLSKTNHVPKWGEKFFNAKSVKIIEDSVLDPATSTLITYTRNIGYKRVLKVDERVEYKDHGNGKTLIVRSAKISSQVFGFSRAIRAFGVERFKSNCTKTVTGLNFVLHKMFPSGLTEKALQQKLEQVNQNPQNSNKSTSYVKTVYNRVKLQLKKIYQFASVKN